MRYFLLTCANTMNDLFYVTMGSRNAESCIDFFDNENKYGFVVVDIRELTINEIAETIILQKLFYRYSFL